MGWKWKVGDILRTNCKITRVDTKVLPKGSLVRIEDRRYGHGYNIVSLSEPVGFVVKETYGHKMEVEDAD